MKYKLDSTLIEKDDKEGGQSDDADRYLQVETPIIGKIINNASLVNIQLHIRPISYSARHALCCLHCDPTEGLLSTERKVGLEAEVNQ